MTAAVAMLSLSCCSFSEQGSEEIIGVEAMAMILKDIHLLRGGLMEIPLLGPEFEVSYLHFEDSVVRKHGVSREKFHSSLDYYLSDAAKLYEIYDVLVDSLMVYSNNENVR